MTSWTQLYNPLGSAGLSALAASGPLLVLFILLATGKIKGWAAAAFASAAALILAAAVWRMPIPAALSAAAYGAAFAVFPILWIVVAALWVYSLSVESGQFRIIRDTLSGMTEDSRLQALFIAFCFGAFLEGCAGFGTPVAITAAMLVGLGFEPRRAAVVCLIANSAPVAFAAAGVPVVTAAEVSGVGVMAISRVLGLVVPVLSLIVPLWLCVILSGWKRSMEVLPAILVAGVSMAGSQIVLSMASGPFMTGVASGLISTGALALFLIVWKPKGAGPRRAARIPFPAALRAWSPFLLMSALVLLWGLPPVKRLLDAAGFSLPWPGLHNLAVRTPPVTAGPSPYPASLGLSILASPGTAIFIAGIISAFILPGLGARKALACLVSTLRTLRATIATVCLVMATAMVMSYAGMSASLGIALSATGALFPIFSPLLGWFGVLITGSDTSSNALFGALQRTTAEQVGLPPALTVAANAAGGVTAKMISPQTLSVATASSGLQGQEGKLFRAAIGHSIAMALIVSLLTLALAYLVPGLVPR